MGQLPGNESTKSADQPVLDLLAEHVPLTLIMDLTSPDGPDSQQILRDEGEPDTDWLAPDKAAK